MKIGQKFNKFTLNEYFFYIDNYKKYTNFNTLGLYRSILENEKLTVEEKILVRDYAHNFFRKQFDFLQLKDPYTFIQNTILGLDLNAPNVNRIWDEVKINQQKILANKRIKHRNFGTYSKHECGHEDCSWNGLMVKQGSWFAESELSFDSDKNRYACQGKAERIKSNRRNKHSVIKKDLELE